MFPHVSRDDYSMTVNEAAAYIESVTGQRPCVKKLYRWIRKGVGGVRLEARRIGGNYYMGRQAVDTFMVKRDETVWQKRVLTPAPRVVNGLHSRVSARPPVNEARRPSAEHEAAMQYLDQRLGLFKFLLCC